MRIRPSIVLLPLLAIAAIAQDRPEAPVRTYRIHKLSLESADLPAPERQSIVHAFQGRTYNLDLLEELVREKLRDSGYATTEVSSAQITRLRRAQFSWEADVTYSVHAGRRYRLNGITFQGGTVFPASVLRAQFHVADGAIFNSTAIGRGLENMRDVYGTAGYPDFGAIPKATYDETHCTISLSVDIDQGRPAIFGKLLLEGVEPRAGAGHKLLVSWKELEGRRYNSQLLKKWIGKNTADWPVKDYRRLFTQNVLGADPGTRNVLLHFD